MDALSMTIKAIPTEYNGYRFRSRLEARWAVAFDHLGISYNYEKEGFDLPSGYYLPDFYLPQISSWIEIKGQAPTDEESAKIFELAAMAEQYVYVFIGQIPYGLELYDDGWSSCKVWPGGGVDYSYWLCECSFCGSIGIQFDGRTDRLDCRESGRCPTSGHGDKAYNYNSPRIIQAYKTARSARFEHGERG